MQHEMQVDLILILAVLQGTNEEQLCNLDVQTLFSYIVEEEEEEEEEDEEEQEQEQEQEQEEQVEEEQEQEQGEEQQQEQEDEQEEQEQAPAPGSGSMNRNENEMVDICYSAPFCRMHATPEALYISFLDRPVHS